MRKLSTRCLNEFAANSRKERKAACEPSLETLDFLRQLARVYQAEPGLQPELCGYMKN